MSGQGKKIGLYGGAFDPVHQMHVALAVEAKRQLELDEVWILIDKQPRGKSTVTPYQDRLAMMKLATKEYDFIVVDSLPMQQEGRTHDHKTVLELSQKYPRHTYFMLMGIDTFLHFPEWEFPSVFCEYAEFAIAERPPHDPALLDHVRSRLGTYADRLGVHVIDLEPSDISSSFIREQLLADEKVDTLHPHVRDYIRTNQLYQTS